MKFITEYQTDIGTTRSINQDNGCIQRARFDVLKGEVCLLAVCDGMGGLSKGEEASLMMSNALCDWFQSSLASFINRYRRMITFEEFKNEMNDLTSRTSTDILKKLQFSGTTAAILLCYEGVFYICNVGDSRVYYMNDHIHQMTVDQTVVQWALSKGEITREEAEKRTDKNVLMQCIGATESVSPEYIKGTFAVGDAFMLCSDGFCHELTEKQYEEAISQMDSSLSMISGARKLIESAKARGESDNITVCFAKVMTEGIATA